MHCLEEAWTTSKDRQADMNLESNKLNWTMKIEKDGGSLFILIGEVCKTKYFPFIETIVFSDLGSINGDAILMSWISIIIEFVMLIKETIYFEIYNLRPKLGRSCRCIYVCWDMVMNQWSKCFIYHVKLSFPAWSCIVNQKFTFKNLKINILRGVSKWACISSVIPKVTRNKHMDHCETSSSFETVQ